MGYNTDQTKCSIYIEIKSKMNHFDYRHFYRRNLPHIQPPGSTFFVTFNLAGSLPRNMFQQWKAEKAQLEAEKLRILKLQNDDHLASVEQLRYEQKRVWYRRFEKTLDESQFGPVWLKDNRIAKVVADSMHYLDGKVYCLDAYCIMANHVHAVFTPLAIQPLRVPQNISMCDNDNNVQTKSLCFNTLSSIMQSFSGDGLFTVTHEISLYRKLLVCAQMIILHKLKVCATR